MADVADRRARAGRRATADPLSEGEPHAPNGVTRRRFVGYLIAAPTVVAAADMFLAARRRPTSRRSSRSTSTT